MEDISIEINRVESKASNSYISYKTKRNKEILKDRLHVASVLCNKSSVYYYRFKNFLIFPNLLISAVSAVLNNQTIEPETLKYYNTCVNSLTVLLIGIQTQWKVSENADVFKNNSNALTSLLHDIENSESREDITAEFIANTNQKYDIIMGALPIIPAHIREEVRNEYGGLKHLPVLINGIKKTVVECDTPTVSKNNVNV